MGFFGGRAKGHEVRAEQKWDYIVGVLMTRNMSLAVELTYPSDLKRLQVEVLLAALRFRLSVVQPVSFVCSLRSRYLHSSEFARLRPVQFGYQ